MKKKTFLSKYSKIDCLFLGFFIGLALGCLVQFLPPVKPPVTTGMAFGNVFWWYQTK